MSAVWNYVSGSTTENGVTNPQCLIDLAELETCGEIAMEVGESFDTELIKLRQWLEEIAPVTR